MSPLEAGVGISTVKLPMYGHYDVCTTWDTVRSLPPPGQSASPFLTDIDSNYRLCTTHPR
jgi:hypothetical protein